VGCVRDWKCYDPTAGTGHITVLVETSEKSEDEMYDRDYYYDMPPLTNWLGGCP